MSDDGISSLISLPSHESWRLSSKQGAVMIEESVFLADVKGPRRTFQVVINGSMGGASEISVNWRLERIAMETNEMSERDGEQGETSELPLDD